MKELIGKLRNPKTLGNVSLTLAFVFIILCILAYPSPLAFVFGVLAPLCLGATATEDYLATKLEQYYNKKGW